MTLIVSPAKVAAPPIPVTLRRAEAPFRMPFDVFNGLSQALGEDQVFIVESLSGPKPDTRSAVVGVNKLLTVEVRRHRVRISGEGAAATQARAAVDHPTRDDGSFELAALSDVWDLLRRIQACFDVQGATSASAFGFGFFGYFGYDTAHYVEDLPYLIAPATDAPDISLSIFQTVVRYDLVASRCEIVSAVSTAWDGVSVETVTAAIEGCAAAHSDKPAPAPAVPAPVRVTDSTTQEVYHRDVATALNYIAIGDIYQVQIGHELSIETKATPREVYARLRARNPAPYMYLARFGDVSVIGASPEVFVRIEDGLVTMRPLAGTVPRSGDAVVDRERSDALLADPKEVAEHIMLVDLCRNDIGRICEPGTLDVDVLMEPEVYSHVIHMVSNVTGTKRARQDPYDVIAATFPAGTMTGTPKIRAMEIIEELEAARRGIYAGAVGMIDFAGFTNLALCIRSTLYTDGVYRIRASAGVVADSVPEKEWRETLAKMGGSYWAITGEEIQP